MIILDIPFQQDKIKELLDNQIIDGKLCQFIKQNKMKLYFKIEDEEESIQTIKNIIKKSEYGASMFYRVSYEK